MKRSRKITALFFSMLAIAGISTTKLDAQCTMTTSEGVNGQCIYSDVLYNYICLERVNNTHCFINGGC